MKLVREALSEIASTFKIYGMSFPMRHAEDLLCDVCSFSRPELYHEQASLTEKEWLTAQLWVQRRIKGEPLPYISGKIQFYNCTFEVNRLVLIPRPETEILVDKMAAILKVEDLQDKVLWDICTGSGCIGIALKKAFPLLTVFLSDISPEAIALAASNAERNGASVQCIEGDLLTPFQGKKAHYIVCNPPYISEEEYLVLDKGVKDFEPQLALLGGKNGLEIYERLAKDLPDRLFPKGRVWLEIGYQQGETVKKLFENPIWKKREVENDWAGHNRFFFLEAE